MIATPVGAQVQAIPAQPTNEREALRGVSVILFNEGDTPVPAQGPRQIEVTADDGTRLVLERLPTAEFTLRPGGFAKVRYVPVAYAARPAAPAKPGKRSAPSTVGRAYMGDPPPPPTAAAEAETLASRGSSSRFLERFSPHEPTYSAFGLRDAGAKLQVSLAFQPVGGESAISHLRFAYTQTMFWRLDLPSGPIAHTTYSPELFADVPIDPTATLGLGWRHDSNGEGPATSIDSNRIFGRFTKTFDLGGSWRAEVTPQAWFYVGRQGGAPDLDRYWGNASLGLTLIKPDSLKLNLIARGNPETGRGAAELFVSYPFAAIDRDIGFYLFGQAFTGHGEALDDYRRRDTHARIGIALTR
ncbi:phospholipase A [Sphingomonas tagetis]|uniref:phospholipase A n=1 Tax=Sphingomonas tagetis TaxID=2949092 RepID=UPI0020B73BE2|nr:phospholipase A [Sphingomonas tagetis]